MAEIPLVTVRQAKPEDTDMVHELASSLPPLIPHTWYTYWDLFTSFGDSCFIAEEIDTALPVGFATSHPMTRTDQVEWFSWQVGIVPDHRGTGLLERLQDKMVGAAVSAGAVAFNGTVEPGNTPSLKAFEKLAHRLGTELEFVEEIPMPTGPDVLYRVALPPTLSS